MSLVYSALNLATTIGDYRSRRDQGQSMLSASLGAYMNYRIYASPWMMAGVMAPTFIRKALIERPTNNQFAIRRSMAAFSGGIVPDNALMDQSRGELMQSAVAANSSLSLAGKSFAGMEASVMHGRYR